jgi:acetyl/propionyl-CoA carboxylase alpha subunit
MERASSEARSSFGDDRLYLEKALAHPRHVEIQILADHFGNAVHLFERECSLQRRHQKIVEESPSPLLTPALREQMGEMALALVRKAGYRNAGTLEFLVDQERRPHFLEMNTRLQVEHPVTEMVTGEDLVALQIRIAQGEPLPFAQKDLRQKGHAIECRVYAEDPERGFLPSPGKVAALRLPDGPGVRNDCGIYPGCEVPIHYDALLSKLVVHGRSRKEALGRLRRAVAEYRILGIATTLPFFEELLRHPAFLSGDYDTSFIEGLPRDPPPIDDALAEVAVVAAAIRSVRARASERAGAAVSAPPTSSWWRAGLADSHRGRL